MAVQLIIDGNGVTDVLAQVHQLADATSRTQAPVQQLNLCSTSGSASGSTLGSTLGLASMGDDMFRANNAVAKRLEKAADAKLTREEQDVAVEEMIAAGAKDIRYEQLTKGRQRAIDDGIAAKEAAEQSVEQAVEPDDQDEFEDMFATDEAPVEVVTSKMVCDMMAQKAKDENGKPIQEMLVKVHAVISKYVTPGKEVMVRNIPEDKLADVYAELKALEQ